MTQYTIIFESGNYTIYAENISFSDDGGAVLRLLDGTVVALVPPNALVINWTSQDEYWDKKSKEAFES
jgi:hypothetical protein